jgi:D-beta-D-heptose 7-phosphate kinase/D-beta-D-heptose 1-phosphate adenosyltransferase
MFANPRAVIEEVHRGFAGRRVVVVGDLMLDRHMWGSVERVSPEAPVPVVRLERVTETAGAAANVARNLAVLGLDVSLAGITGGDPERDLLLKDLAANGIDTSSVLSAADRITTVKTRVIGNHQQMIRIDSEYTLPIDARHAECLLGAVLPQLRRADALVLSDYAKGVLTDQVCRQLIQSARKVDIPVLVDPKGRDFARFAGATLITPNRSELAYATGISSSRLDPLLTASSALRETLGLQWLVLTLSAQGIAMIGPEGIRQIPAVARDVFDVSGAGDTVLATFTAGLSAGIDPIDTAHLANLAAGVVVGKVGTATVAQAELLAAVTGESALEQAAKICSLEQALEHTREWKAAGERIVFTNGCFDLLHVGHVTYLERARRHGQRLIVGLNSDRSVRILKGPDRPVILQDDRARVLAALASVDAVVIFDEPTPLTLIEQLRPDVLAKGADYSKNEIVGAKQVESWDGQVVLVPLVANRSTTSILRHQNRPDTDASTDHNS